MHILIFKKFISILKWFLNLKEHIFTTPVNNLTKYLYPVNIRKIINIYKILNCLKIKRLVKY